MRKLLLLAVMALAALAVSAPSAFATNPDFPHGDHDPEDWVSVQVYSNPSSYSCDTAVCSIDTGTNNAWEWQMYASSGYPHCMGGFEGAVNGNGSYGLGNLTLYTFVHYWPSEPFCSTQGMGWNWSGQMCAHVPSGEVWTRQGIDLQYADGDSFGQVLGSGSDPLVASTLRFGDGSGSYSYVNSQFSHQASFPLGDGFAVYQSGEGPAGGDPEPCWWPELEV